MYLAEYIWIDGSKPTAKLRSKTKVLEQKPEKFPIWCFDGSSTQQAEGQNSDCILKPVFICNDPFRSNGSLVLCEVVNPELTPHETNKRCFAKQVQNKYSDREALFGMEQEYTLFKENWPMGFPKLGYPEPQGKYYCGVGADAVFGREIAEKHLEACIDAQLKVSGINAEVMPGQWEFQIGPIGTVDIGDQIWVARYILQRVCEMHNVVVSFEPKPQEGDWNGAGCHMNFSTKQMRESLSACEAACVSLGNNIEEHIKNYGHDIEKRLTGLHETCSYKEFRWGISDRTASIRIPWSVIREQKGYIEDRRPNANCDPYSVSGLILKTVMEFS